MKKITNNGGEHGEVGTGWCVGDQPWPRDYAQRLALPLLDLAPVLQQPAGTQARDEAAEAAAGVH